MQVHLKLCHCVPIRAVNQEALMSIELDLNMKRIIFIVDIISKTTSFVSYVLVQDLELFVPGMTTRKRM